jgi:hypothetical protein
LNGFSGFDNWSLYIGTLIYLVSGVVLIFKAKSISFLILRPDENVVEKFEISHDFQKGALRIIGIYVAIFAFPALVHIAGQIIKYELLSSDIPEHLVEKPNYIVSLVSQSVRFFLGIFLALGAESVIKVLARFDKTVENMSK